jgi:hypothetical protein
MEMPFRKTGLSEFRVPSILGCRTRIRRWAYRPQRRSYSSRMRPVAQREIGRVEKNYKRDKGHVDSLGWRMSTLQRR